MSNLDSLIDELSKLSILEASNLVKKLEDKWNIRSGDNVTMSQINNVKEKPVIKKTEFDVELTEVGPKKIQVIKIIREITSLGLKESKAMVDGVPKVVKCKTSKEDADVIKTKLEEHGAKVIIK